MLQRMFEASPRTCSEYLLKPVPMPSARQNLPSHAGRAARQAANKSPWRDFPLKPLSEVWISEDFRILQGHPLTTAESDRDASERRRRGASDHYLNGGFADRLRGLLAPDTVPGQCKLRK